MTLDDILIQARKVGASDVHVSVGIPIKCRIHGTLQNLTQNPLTGADTKTLVEQMIPKRLIADFNDTGEADFSYAIPDQGRFRVNVFKQKGSMAFVIRLINSEIPQPEDLGLTDSVIDLVNRKRGLVLVTGPTGSGKSTTLASLINRINENYSHHVITLEDPIEYLHQHKQSVVNQREIGMDTDNYGNALRAALREDPDVILVGEMRDLDTISTAITAAETGHLVFSTLHTIGAAATIDRVIDVFPPHQQPQIRLQLATLLEAIISQQLLKTADGNGRVAAFEILHATTPVRALIREGKGHQIPSVIQTSRKQGMITMDDCIFDLYSAGTVSKDEAMIFAQDKDALAKRLV
ncbi:MAG: type IV pilus twitching motility protein PilT [Eubacterium sp.]|nr:type IV pilus twitching motility protein PilT [Eubacterium sp.]